MIVSLILILTVSIFFAAAKQEKVENILPCVFLSVISLLFPFYCLDMLRLGRILAYILMAAVMLGSAVVLVRSSGLQQRLRSVLSPGLALYVCLCVFVLLYTKDNLAGLWDELRLWAAVPKAMYMTEELQLGPDAMVFRLMQPYPPGMPLLVYFMNAPSGTFVQGYIFSVYGILFHALILPAFTGLKWKHKPLFLTLLIGTAFLPCVLTSHGGDFGWFYESLFIDPILGALAGYTFFLAGTKPFASGFSTFRFAVTLLSLTIIKDSGAMFALVAALCAVVIFLLEAPVRGKWKYAALHCVQGLAPVALGYFLWKRVLLQHGVSTNLDHFMNRLPPLSSLLALAKQLRSQPMIVLDEPLFLTEFTITYIPCVLILLALTIWFVRKQDKKTWISVGINWLAVLFSVGIFFLGYIISYHNAQSSFQRYTGSTLICMVVFTLLRGSRMSFGRTEPMDMKRIFRKRSVSAWLLAALTLYTGLSLVLWRGKKWDMEYAQKHAVPAVSRILDVVGDEPANSQNVYLLVSETPASYSLAHHRIYCELLGSPACVRNFWNDTNVVGGDKTPETWTPEEMDEITAKWQEKLKAGGYDFIYLITLNDFTTAVLAEFGIPDPAVGDVLVIGWQNDEMKFTKAEISPDALPIDNAG